ncbi:hypothetical protein ACFSTD_21090 [Novosphingobium colocasiae]
MTSIGFASPYLESSPSTAGYFLTLPASAYRLTNIGHGVARSYAFYGAGTYSLSDTVKLSGGIRYNDDRRKATVRPYYADLAIPGFGTGFLRIWHLRCPATVILRPEPRTQEQLRDVGRHGPI